MVVPGSVTLSSLAGFSPQLTGGGGLRGVDRAQPGRYVGLRTRAESYGLCMRLFPRELPIESRQAMECSGFVPAVDSLKA